MRTMLGVVLLAAMGCHHTSGTSGDAPDFAESTSAGPSDLGTASELGAASDFGGANDLASATADLSTPRDLASPPGNDDLSHASDLAAQHDLASADLAAAHDLAPVPADAALDWRAGLPDGAIDFTVKINESCSSWSSVGGSSYGELATIRIQGTNPGALTASVDGAAPIALDASGTWATSMPNAHGESYTDGQLDALVVSYDEGSYWDNPSSGFACSGATTASP